MHRLVYALTWIGLAATVTPAVQAGEWPTLLGPLGNGIAEGEELLTTWPEGGPEVVWQRDVGEGYSSVSVAGGRAFVFDRVDDELRVTAVAAETGRDAWQRRFPCEFQTGFSSDDGPRSAPVVAAEHVFLYGPQGRLWCLAAATGETVWERDTHRDYDAPEGYFGAGSTPVVEGDVVIVNVGSRRDKAGIVAFDRTTGRTVWTATDELASYSSPIARTIDGVRHVVFVTRLKCLSLDPTNGHVRFAFDFGARGPTVNAASPLVLGNHLFVSAHYRVGAVYGTIGKEGFDETWQTDELLSAHYATPIEYEGHLYGIDGQERVREGSLRCVDPRTKTILWNVDDFGYAMFVRAGPRILAMKTTGELLLLEANPRKYVELARARVGTSTSRVVPALANGLLYVRDESTVRCLRVGRPSP